MQQYLVLHYGEIALKTGNRKYFEKQLLANIRSSLIDFGRIKLSNVFGRFLIEVDSAWDLTKVYSKLQKVFGLEYFSLAWNSSQDIKQIENDLLLLLKDKSFSTFRITARRANKAFSLNSQEICQRLGEVVMKKLKKKVDLEKYDLNCFVEIVNNFVLLYFDKIICRGGLPVGVSGKLLCLISGGIDSPVAANLMQKRGAPVVFVNFDAYPATAKENQDKVKDLVTVLKQYQAAAKLYLVPFLKVQQEIVKIVPPDYRVVFYRRMMLRLAEMIAVKENMLALVTGESLGQVASQTVENIYAISQAINLPILRPLIGFNKEEIITLAKQINTYDLSIQPFADCCSLYIPTHPVTRSDLNLILETEQDWSFADLLNDTLNNTETFNF